MLRAAIIGLGNVGCRYDIRRPPGSYLSHAKCLENHESIELVAGVDISEENRHIFEETYNKPTFKTIEKLREYKSSIELVVIAVNTERHLQICLDVLNLIRPKYLIIEKPGGLNNDERNKVKSSAESINCKVVINFQRRALKYFSDLRLSVRNKQEEITGISCLYYGNFWVNGIHGVDLAYYLLEEQYRGKEECLKTDFRNIFSTRKLDNKNHSTLLMIIDCRAKQILFDLFSGQIYEFEVNALMFNENYRTPDYKYPILKETPREMMQKDWYAMFVEELDRGSFSFLTSLDTMMLYGEFFKDE